MYLKKKIPVIICTFVLCMSTVVTSYAKDIPKEGKPNVTWGSHSIQDYHKYSGPSSPNDWFKRGEGKRYYDWDSEVFNCYAPSANESLSLKTESYIDTSGGLEFNFGDVVKAETGKNVGEKWTRTSTVTYDAEQNYKYTLWAANVQKVMDYEYLDTTHIGRDNFYTNTIYGNYGSEKWFFREPL